MILAGKLLSWMLPERWRTGIILGLAAVVAWEYAGGLRKDIVIATQKVEIADTRDAAKYIINATNEAGLKQQAETAKKEKEQNDRAHATKREFELIRHDVADTFRVLMAMAKTGASGVGSSSGGLPESSANIQGGDNTVGQQQGSGESAFGQTCTSTFYLNALMDNIAVQECREYAVKHNIPVME